jgi:hypothetical protein
VGLLQLLPDRPEVRANVEMGDVQRAREALGVTVPPPEVDGRFNEQGFIEYVQALTPLGNPRNSLAVDLRFLGGNASSRYLFVMAQTTYQSMGITPFDVDQWVTGGTLGSSTPGEVSGEFHAVRGDFNTGAIESRLKECTACPAANVDDRRGWRIHGWVADFEANESLRLKPPMFDQFGRGGRLAVSDGVLLRALSTPDIHAMVDAAEGTGSLADNDDFRLAAEGLQRLDAWNAWLTQRTLGPWKDAIGVLLKPYTVMAHGDGYQDGKRYLVIALVHRTAEEAAENARAARTRRTSAADVCRTGAAALCRAACGSAEAADRVVRQGHQRYRRTGRRPLAAGDAAPRRVPFRLPGRVVFPRTARARVRRRGDHVTAATATSRRSHGSSGPRRAPRRRRASTPPEARLPHGCARSSRSADLPARTDQCRQV